jgi:UDP-glucose 4-epimerase
MRKILVVGGAGYIGSHMVQMLSEEGYHPVVLDNLSTGHRDAIRDGDFVLGHVGDPATVSDVLTTHRIDAVMHFAALSQVAASMADPGSYYRNNVAATLNLLEGMRHHGVRKFVFSSTAAVYGQPEESRITEQTPTAPINPYGHSKRMVEQILDSYDQAYGMRYIALRYFNAAGADPKGRLGERHNPETHLIPLALQSAAGQRNSITVYGTDYPTADGTCIRDYVHVHDLCRAHLLALEHLDSGAGSGIFNLGNGDGFSVNEVIGAVRRVTGRRILGVNGPRRKGDPTRLVADASRARRVLGWMPQLSNIETIVAHAWAWHLGSRRHSTSGEDVTSTDVRLVPHGD